MTVSDINILNIILIVAGLVVGWFILKFLLRLTTRIACGCIGLLALGAIVWFLSQIL
jgi:hypothetical protein